MTLAAAVERALGAAPRSSASLSGGCVAHVERVEMPDGRTLVAKYDAAGGSGFECEAMMLEYLASETSLPVPAVVHASSTLLLMEHLPGATRFDRAVETHAAELLAALHDVTSDTFGFDEPTVIATLPQSNRRMSSWASFFGEQRLAAMADMARDAGRLPGDLHARVLTLVEQLDRHLDDPGPPSLVHGDVWSGNVLAERGRVTGFIDPAIYFADAEVELAFIAMFSTFGETFWRRYDEVRGIRAGFREERCALYQLYPLLVHVRLFGGSYVGSVEGILGRLGR